MECTGRPFANSFSTNTIQKKSTVYVLVHIVDVIKPTNCFQIIVLYNAIRGKFDKLNVKTIFLLKSIEDVQRLLLWHSNIRASEDCVFLSEDGEYYISDSERRQIENFISLDDDPELRLSYEDLLKLKLIRKIGHFVRIKDGEHVSCQKYFYDGTYCQKEIIHLLYEQIENKIENDKKLGIVFLLPDSFNHWAVQCFHNIHEKLKKKFKDVRLLTDEFDKVEQVILLTGVVVSGETLRDKYNAIHEKSKAKIVPFSIIYCDNSEELDESMIKNQVVISNGTSNILLHYLIKKKQDYQNKAAGECTMCRPELKIAQKTFNDNEINPALSSFEMWSMVIESGLHEEHFNPDPENTRRFSVLPPNTLKMMRFNGAYMSLMFQKLLLQNGIDFPRTGFIAYPDETNNPFAHYQNLSADKVPSSLFITFLNLICEYNRLPIPRILIEEVKNNPSIINEIKLKSYKPPEGGGFMCCRLKARLFF